MNGEQPTEEEAQRETPKVEPAADDMPKEEPGSALRPRDGRLSAGGQGRPTGVVVGQRERRSPWRGSCATPACSPCPGRGSPAHVEENCGALDVALSQDDLDELDAAFLPPAGRRPLEML